MSGYDILRTANKETFHTIEHADGRKTLYFTDNRGREFFSLFGSRGAFQGTHPLNRKLQNIQPQPK